MDTHQDCETVELKSSSSDFLGVSRLFHSTLSRDSTTILRVFRVQNPSLWDKYCSSKRSMTPRGASADAVDERKLFHGTPTLEAARGICFNNMDFRRAGENAGALYGKGSYFSSNAVYSHSFTQGPYRYMFLAKVLVGKYVEGDKSFSSPPMREGLKRYDSCVDNEVNPTIFVIFDLNQSYPEYLIQYKDTEPGPGLSSVGTRAHGPSASAAAQSTMRSTERPVQAPCTPVNPYSQSSAHAGAVTFKSARSQFMEDTPGRREMPVKSPSQKKHDDNCIIS